MADEDLSRLSTEELESRLATLDYGPEVAPVVVTGRKRGTLEKAFGNVPRSAGELVKNTVTPFLHPVQTAKTLGDLGAGTLQRAVQAIPGPLELRWDGQAVKTTTADATWDYLKQRYGGADNLRKTFEEDPVGLLADASMLLTGGGSAAARAPGMVGRVGSAANKIGRAVDPVAAMVRTGSGAAKTVGKMGAGTLAVATGKGARPFREAAKAGYEGGSRAQAFKEHMTGDRTTDDILESAKAAVDKMYAERSANYQAGMGAVHADPTVLDFVPIEQAVQTVEDLAYTKGHSGTAAPVSINPGATKALGEIKNVVAEWRALDPAEFHTPGQLDKLKQTVGNIRDAQEIGSPARKVTDDVYSAIRKQIADQAPAYAPVMEAYETASRTTKDLQKAMSLGDKASTVTALNRLQRVLNPPNKRAAELGETLEKYASAELAPSIAGATLAEPLPTGARSLAKAGVLGLMSTQNPMLWPAILTMSPRLAGSAAFRAGTAARYPGKTLAELNKIYQTTPGRVGALGLSRVESALPDQPVEGGEPVEPGAAPDKTASPNDLSNLSTEELEARLQALGDEEIPSDVYRSAMLAAEGTAKNPNSTAVGPGQIIDPTFASYAKRLMPEREEWFKGKSNEAIADALRGTKFGDTTIEDVILGEIEKDDRALLQRLNKPATGGNLYLAHFLGNDDAAKVFSADPNTLVRELAPEIIRPNAAITHNGRALKDMTVGDLAGWATATMNKRLEQVRNANQ